MFIGADLIRNKTLSFILITYIGLLDGCPWSLTTREIEVSPKSRLRPNKSPYIPHVLNWARVMRFMRCIRVCVNCFEHETKYALLTPELNTLKSVIMEHVTSGIWWPQSSLSQSSYPITFLILRVNHRNLARDQIFESM